MNRIPAAVLYPLDATDCSGGVELLANQTIDVDISGYVAGIIPPDNPAISRNLSIHFSGVGSLAFGKLAGTNGSCAVEITHPAGFPDALGPGTYQFDFFVRAVSGTWDTFTVISYSDNYSQSYGQHTYTIVDSSWTEIQYRFTVPAGYNLGHIFLFPRNDNSGQAGSVYVDNLSLRQLSKRCDFNEIPVLSLPVDFQRPWWIGIDMTLGFNSSKIYSTNTRDIFNLYTPGYSITGTPSYAHLPKTGASGCTFHYSSFGKWLSFENMGSGPVVSVTPPTFAVGDKLIAVVAWDAANGMRMWHKFGTNVRETASAALPDPMLIDQSSALLSIGNSVNWWGATPAENLDRYNNNGMIHNVVVAQGILNNSQLEAFYANPKQPMYEYGVHYPYSGETPVRINPSICPLVNPSN